MTDSDYKPKHELNWEYYAQTFFYDLDQGVSLEHIYQAFKERMAREAAEEAETKESGDV